MFQDEKLTDKEILLCSKGFPMKFKAFKEKSRKPVRRQRYWAKTVEGRERRLQTLKGDKVDFFKQVTFRLQKEAYLQKRAAVGVVLESWKRLLPTTPIKLPTPLKKDNVVVKPNPPTKVPREIKIVPYQGPADFVGSILQKKWAV
jgi:hypothetical protein